MTRVLGHVQGPCTHSFRDHPHSHGRGSPSTTPHAADPAVGSSAASRHDPLASELGYDPPTSGDTLSSVFLFASDRFLQQLTCDIMHSTYSTIRPTSPPQSFIPKD